MNNSYFVLHKYVMWDYVRRQSIWKCDKPVQWLHYKVASFGTTFFKIGN